MKIHTYRVSDRENTGTTQEWDSLDECIEETMLETGIDMYVVREPHVFDNLQTNVDWIVEIYDDYRE